MISTIRKWRPRPLKSILGSFQSTVDELNAFVAANDTKAEQKAAANERHSRPTMRNNNDIDALNRESSQANAVAGKILSLISA